MSDLQDTAAASASFTGIPEERLFVRNPHIQASASRSNTIFVGGSFLATIVAVLQLIFGTVTPAAPWVTLILYIIGMVGIGILRDAPLQKVSQSYSKIVIAGLVVPAVVVGLIDGSWKGAFDGVLWGGGVRLFAGIMLPSAVNSFGHMTGRRPHATSDQSPNVWWLALLTLGEGWHNNHHAFPASARLGFRWWQVDPIWWLIRLSELARLV